MNIHNFRIASGRVDAPEFGSVSGIISGKVENSAKINQITYIWGTGADIDF